MRHESPDPSLDGFSLASDHLTDVLTGDFAPFSKSEPRDPERSNRQRRPRQRTHRARRRTHELLSWEV